MKKIIFSSILLLTLISNSFLKATNASSLSDGSQSLFDGRNELDPIDPETSSTFHDPEVMDDKDVVGDRIKDDSDDSDDFDSSDLNKDHSDDSDVSDDKSMNKPMNKVDVTTEASSHSSPVKFPTAEEIEGQIKSQQKIATKYKKLAEVLNQLNKEHQIEISSDLIKMVEDSYKQHQKIVDINEAMLTIINLGYGFTLDSKLGSDLLNENKKAFKQAIETTAQAVKELKDSLGLQLTFEV